MLMKFPAFLSFPKCKHDTDAVCNNMTCSGHGSCNATTGVCECDRLYSGDFCQNKGSKKLWQKFANRFSNCCFIDDLLIFPDECVDDSDCSNQGSCIDIKATTFPSRQCFCNPGWFGESCSRGMSLVIQS